jgi:large subunit ribosomal protein L21
MKYAVIKVNGNQYKVSENEELLIDKLVGKPEAEVLLMVDGDSVSVGKPTLSTLNVQLKVLAEEEKGKKLVIQKYKAKSRYRRKTGFRPVYTRVLVESFGEAKASKAKKESKSE